MAYISREQFLKLQEERQERALAAQNSGPRIGYFSLKDNGDEAIVRFCYTDPDQFDILTTHPITGGDKFKRVNCLRESFKDDINTCPLCAAGQNIQQRFYIKLIEYTRDENGNIVATPKIWERPTSYVNIIGDVMEEYGNDCIFKVKRNGARGDQQTTYSIMMANPNVYNSELYPNNPNAFDGYNVLGTAVLDKTYEELQEMVSEYFPSESTPKSTFTEQNSAPRKVTY